MRLGIFIAAIWLVWSGSAAADILGVRASAEKGAARLVVDLDRATPFRAFALKAPARIVVDFPKLAWRSNKGLRPGKTVKALRHGFFRSDVYRLVFDLARDAAIANAQLIPGKNGKGQRLVVDLKVGKAPERKHFGAFKPPRRTQQAAAPKPRPERVIVIDAGHGGQDPGAIGYGGVVEKRINLKVAKAVARILETYPGYRVTLTRSTDIFLRLRERVRRGRKAGADLFLSIHADSHPDPGVSGASLYTLSEKASDKEAERLARSENKADLIGGAPIQKDEPEVFNILIDLAQRETKNRSSSAADDLLFALAANQPLLRRPKRAAGFAVLKAPDVPSVLIELGFLSNAEDAKRLASVEGRETIARAIAAGIVRYFDGANTARAQSGG